MPSIYILAYLGYLVGITLLVLLIKYFLLSKIRTWAGIIGERDLYKKLQELDSNYYRIISDLWLPSKGNIPVTQVDFVIISNFGIFCIEVKAHQGWIKGNAYHEHWTQCIYRYKNEIPNAIWQNYAHVKALEDVLGETLLKAPIVSLVVFSEASRVEVTDTNYVNNMFVTLATLREFKKVIYTTQERDTIYNLLIDTNILDKRVRKMHNQAIRKFHYS